MKKMKKFEELDYEQLRNQTNSDFHGSKSDTVGYPDIRNMNRDELKDYLENIGVPSNILDETVDNILSAL